MSIFKKSRDTQLIPNKVTSVHTFTGETIPDGIKMINAQDQWDRGNQGEGVVVAIIDTGVDYNHPDLQENIIGGRDFTGKGDYMDGHGHGTHVAGTIAAANNSSGIVGVAPKAKILALKALKDDGTGDMNWTISAIRFAVKQKVDVINMSLGGQHSYALRKAVQEAVSAGIIIVAAAGNEGDGDEGTEELSYPGAYPEVIEVGAVDFGGILAEFSNTNKEVDILAPGVDVFSTYPNGKYARMSGTSMATPHMTGAVALLKSIAIADYTKGTHILNLAVEEPVEPPKEDPVPEPDLEPVPIPTPAPETEPTPIPPPVKPISPLLLLRLILLLLRKK